MYSHACRTHATVLSLYLKINTQDAELKGDILAVDGCIATFAAACVLPYYTRKSRTLNLFVGDSAYTTKHSSLFILDI